MTVPFTLIVQPDVVHDEIAADPETLELLIAYLGIRFGAQPSGPFGAAAMSGLPLVRDPELPQGEVHVRCTCPVPYRPAERDASLRQMLDYFADALRAPDLPPSGGTPTDGPAGPPSERLTP